MARIPGSSLGDMISGSQVAMHGICMFRQMVRVCLTWGILLILIFVSWNLWQIQHQHPQQINAAIMYGKATWLGIIYSDDTVFHFTRRDGRPGSVTIAQVRTLPAFRASWVATRDRLVGDVVIPLNGQSDIWKSAIRPLPITRYLRLPLPIHQARMLQTA